MTQENKNLFTQPVESATWSKKMLQGATIALILIVLFLAGVDESKPEWGQLWMVRPLLIVPIAGAMGGLFFYFVEHPNFAGAWPKAIKIIIGAIGYLIALWLGTVLGLDGTLWN